MSKDLRKTVELATKPKRAAPKAKYIDPIVQSTFSQDGALQEIIRTLSLRLRDPNTTVAFKALITLHTIMRSGALEPVYSYLSTSSISMTLSSHEAPNISAYGHYLSARIKSYSNLKRDVIRDKSDRRAKDRLRKLKVEQGLLRETREIQRMIAACVESKFYTDDVDDDVSMTALRLLTKDLLVLFTCVNEGMINILEHYFEMSHADATTALKIYKTFCKDTERVVAYLGIAKKLYNVLNVPIPNLKHAPVSLAGSLEEYLNDPNFEKNRQEYRENKRVADGGEPSTTPRPSATSSSSTSAPSTSAVASTSTSTTEIPSSGTAGGGAPAKSFTDFFESIEQSQTSMFPGSPSINGTLSSQMTGFGTMGPGGGGGAGMPNPFGIGAMGGSPFGQFPTPVQPQMTGFNPFLQPQLTGYQQPQMTGFQQPQFTGFQAQQPQMTGMGMGANPFRQSMMPTGGGAQPFGMVQPQMTGNPFQQQQPQQQQQQPFLQNQNTGFNAFGGGGMRPMSMMAPQQQQPQATGQNPFIQQQQQPPSRSNTLSPSYSTPSLSTIPQASQPPPQPSTPSSSMTPAPLTAQKTGARNPFAPAPGTLIPQTIPEEPKGPSMNQLAYSQYNQQQQQQQPNGLNGTGGVGGGMNGQEPKREEPKKPQDAFSKFLEAQKTGTLPLTSQKTGGLFASIASDFTFDRGNTTSSPPPQTSSLSTPFSSLSLSSTSQPPSSSSFLSSQPTGTTSSTFLSSQPTGTSPSFASNTRKPFQPTSSFGSTLFNEFSTSSPSPSSSAFQSQNVNSSSQTQSQQTNGTTSPQPLQPQSTGYNPFAGSKLPPLNSTLNGGSMNAFSVNGAGGGGGVATGSLI
ncbi:hypothetical protein JCM3765_003005 [Sporobolomyces pararoseus]